MFGGQGSTAFLVKITTLLAALFFISSLVLGYWSGHMSHRNDVLQGMMAQQPVVQQAESKRAEVKKPSLSRQPVKNSAESGGGAAKSISKKVSKETKSLKHEPKKSS